MGVLIQVRDVPEDVHRKLKSRAAAQGISLSEYVRRMMERDARRPSMEELSARIEARGRVHLDPPSEEIIREIRGPLPPPPDE
jgi:plasmid stability protein